MVGGFADLFLPSFHALLFLHLYTLHFIYTSCTFSKYRKSDIVYGILENEYCFKQTTTIIAMVATLTQETVPVR